MYSSIAAVRHQRHGRNSAVNPHFSSARAPGFSQRQLRATQKSVASPFPSTAATSNVPLRPQWRGLDSCTRPTGVTDQQIRLPASESAVPAALPTYYYNSNAYIAPTRISSKRSTYRTGRSRSSAQPISVHNLYRGTHGACASELLGLALSTSDPD
uniref:Uncharacterized protein n=1 Tax=Mycena chlorophos TaxID=658473 RepID=A0ABQ0L3Z5_MYCCL|nr:predicted protein [Mycena chlorophos]